MLRCFIENTGTTIGAAYHVKMKGAMGLLALLRVIPRNMRIVDFETEFTDGTFLNTNNCLGLNPTATCPEIASNQFDPNTSLEELLSFHRQELRKIITERSLEPVLLATIGDLLACQDRMHTLQSEYKKARGYVTPDEFERIAGKKLSRDQNEFVKEFERIRDTEEAN
ncbi:MAG: hypothetical protein IID43_02070 [Planctomycetes bacterium]|nr:hypothetical protein [Planctomycetota bacterium]